MSDIPTFEPVDTDGSGPPPSRPFRLKGKRLSTDEAWDETFHVLGDIPQGPLAALAASVSIQDGNIVYGTTATVRFMRAVIVPLDEAAFDALLEDKDRPVQLDQLGAAMLWAAGIATGRPTGPLPSSTGGQRDTEPGSEDGPSSPDAPPAG